MVQQQKVQITLMVQVIDDIVISAGSTTGTVSFTPTDDSLYDATSNETATIAISGVSGGSASESGTHQLQLLSLIMKVHQQ